MLEDVVMGLNLSEITLARVYLSSDKVIKWDSGNSLLIEKPDKGYMVRVTYFRTDGDPVILNDLTSSDTDIYLTKGEQHYLISGGSLLNDGRPEVQLSLPKLEKDEEELLAAFHEIGHDRVENNFKNGSGIPLFAAEFSSSGQYSRINMSPKEKRLQRWNERQAWYHGLKIMRELEVKIPGLESASALISKINGYLSTYGAEHSSSYRNLSIQGPSP